MFRLNKVLSILIVILCLLSTLLLKKQGVLVKGSSMAIEVPTDYPTIQEAVNNATPGATILVHKGTYYEDVVINKSVSLVGEDRDLTVIAGSQALYIVYITADSGAVRNFTVRKNATSQYSAGILVVSSGNVIEDNWIDGVQDGLILASASDNTVSDNLISDSSEGISLYYSSNNVFSSNSISNSSGGVGLYFSSRNNVFYHNNFRDTVQISNGSMNIWSYQGEGNYWINYTGRDSNGDGIGDTSYVVDASNRDNHPLAGMFSNFSVLLGNETRHVGLICNSTVSDFIFEAREGIGSKTIQFSATGKDGTSGFARIMIPTELIKYPIIIIKGEEIIPTFLGISNTTINYLYFAYAHSSLIITIVSSKALYLYNELFNENLRLQSDLHNLNVTYYDLLNNHSIRMQIELSNLTARYYDLLNSYTTLLSNYSQLQLKYLVMNSSYQDHLMDFSESTQNIQNLIYILVATTGIFLTTIIYLSKRANPHKIRANSGAGQ